MQLSNLYDYYYYDAPSASSLVDVCARTIHDISLLHCKGRWHFASAAAGDAAVSAAFGCWLRAEPGMAAADPAAASVNAFSSAYVRGHTYHALAYTRKSTSNSEAVSWQTDMLQDDGACSTVAVQTDVPSRDAPRRAGAGVPRCTGVSVQGA